MLVKLLSNRYQLLAVHCTHTITAHTSSAEGRRNLRKICLGLAPLPYAKV